MADKKNSEIPKNRQYLVNDKIALRNKKIIVLFCWLIPFSKL